MHCRVTYTSTKISQAELNSKYLREVLLQYWVSNAKPAAACPFLSIYLYKLYLAAEFAVSACCRFACQVILAFECS